MAVLQPWHFGITVSDLEHAIGFYCDGLGLRLRHRQTQDNEYTARMLGYPSCRIEIAQLQCAAVHGVSQHMIELIQFTTPTAVHQPGPMHRVGTVHVALLVEEIDEMLARARRHGARSNSDVVDITAGINTGGKVVWLTDPDGVLIEMVQPCPRPTSDDNAPIAQETP